MTVDHLVYGTPDVERTVADLERRTGVRAARGGRHPGRGTHNALLSLGGGRYLEIIGPDPGQAAFRGPLPFDLDGIRQARLVTWAVKAAPLEDRVRSARARGYDPGVIVPRSREQADGTVLRWRLTSLGPDHPDWLVPFLIDWGRSPHPSDTSPAGLTLRHLRAVHPDPPAVQRALHALGVELEIERGPSGQLMATLDTPRGVAELSTAGG